LDQSERTNGLAFGYWCQEAAGRMFWLTLKEVSGSYFAFTDAETFVVFAVGRLDTPLDLVVLMKLT